MKYLEHNGNIISKVEIADTEFKKRLGLMFRISHPKNTSFLFSQKNLEQNIIHMLFMFFSVDVILLDKKFRIIHLAHLRPFIDILFPKNAAYIIETKSGTIKNFNLCVKNQLHLRDF